MRDRRNEPRKISTFKSAYVRTEQGLHFVTLRNISDSGICLDTYPGVAEGQQIEYCIDSAGPRTGIVRWVHDGRFGVSADAAESPAIDLAAYPARSVRIPLSFSAHLFVGGRQEQVIIHNLSIRGTCISSLPGFEPGQLVSVKIADTVFELASIRWVAQGRAGVRFAAPIHPAAFRDLVARLQQPAKTRCSGASKTGAAQVAADGVV